MAYGPKCMSPQSIHEVVGDSNIINQLQFTIIIIMIQVIKQISMQLLQLPRILPTVRLFRQIFLPLLLKTWILCRVEMAGYACSNPLPTPLSSKSIIFPMVLHKHSAPNHSYTNFILSSGITWVLLQLH
jgi:hypothetical protein